MRVAIQNPMFTAAYGSIGIHDYVIDFVREFRPIIYLSGPALYYQWLKFAHKNKLGIRDWKIVYSAKKLNNAADVLISFSGMPSERYNRPPKEFSGLKIFHIMDYMYKAKESYLALCESGVDYLFGYAAHDKHCNFFQRFYPDYTNRVVSVPFGFHKRFVSNHTFSERQNKVVALGSINVFGDRMKAEKNLEAIEYFLFQRKEPFMHKFRRQLIEKEKDFIDFMDSRLPHYPRQYDFAYDLVEEFNAYKMFTCCESLFYFPAAKTFEGPASGSVLVCSDHPCFDDLGFVDGVNCVRHKQFDTEDFQRIVKEYLSDQQKLQKIQEEGTKFVKARYSHEAVAKNLMIQIERVYAP